MIGKSPRIAIFDVLGRINADVIKRLISEDYRLSPFGREISISDNHSAFYICGPADFEASVREALHENGVKADAIHSESFSRPDDALSVPSPERTEVRFKRSGKTTVWSQEDGLSLLELAEAVGVAADSGCRMGICGACEAAILAETDSLTANTMLDLPPGHTLLCCAHPQTPVIELDL